MRWIYCKGSQYSGRFSWAFICLCGQYYRKANQQIFGAFFIRCVNILRVLLTSKTIGCKKKWTEMKVLKWHCQTQPFTCTFKCFHLRIWWTSQFSVVKLFLCRGIFESRWTSSLVGKWCLESASVDSLQSQVKTKSLFTYRVSSQLFNFKTVSNQHVVGDYPYCGN